MSQLWSRVSGSKLKDLPGHLRVHAGEHYTYGKLQERAATTLANYKKELDAGSAKPLWDTMIGVFVLSYAIAWPTEYRHYMHEQEAKLKGPGEEHH